nr:uncharacterized protein At4g15970-like [Coffea arabica]
MACLLRYPFAFNNYQILLATPDQDSYKHSPPPQVFSLRKASIMIPSPSSHHDESIAEGDLSSPSFEHELDPKQGYNNISSSADSVPENPSSPADSVPRNLSSLVNQENEETKLQNILSKAATVTKTVIITTVNAAWTAPNSIFDLFLEGLRSGNQTQALLNHLVVGAMDQKAYSRCLELHPHCIALTTDGVDFSGKANFMSEDYLKIVWRKLEFQRTVLEMGYSIIFTDADILWFRDPFRRFYSDADFQIACDHFGFNSTDLNNSPNSGFIYVRSNNMTIQFYKFWCKSREAYPSKHDQDVLNMIKFDPFISKIGLKIRFLDTAYFGGICEPSKDLNVVCTMHANCCTSLETKAHGLQMMIDDWKIYMTKPGNRTKPHPWTSARYCSK